VPTPDRPLPIYVQIANHYRDAILNGDLRAGQRLPAVAEIAEEWGVAVGTASRALSQLQVEGAVYTSPQGSFVADGDVIRRTPSDRIKAAKRVKTNGESVEVTAADVVTAPNYVADLLGVPIGSQVVRREEITWHKGHPLMLGVDWIAVTADRALAGHLTAREPMKGGTAHIVQISTGRRIRHVRDHVRGRAADAREAGALRLPVGSPILAGTHVWSDDESVIIYGEWVMPPDRVVSWEWVAEDEAGPVGGDDT
jgi:GntR family transcriptional regulator